MKIKFDDKEPFKDLRGEEIKIKKDSKESLTFRSACIEALLANPPDDRASGKEKLRRFELAQTLSNVEESEFDVSVEDISLIKSMAGKTFVTIVVGRLYTAIEQKD